MGDAIDHRQARPKQPFEDEIRELALNDATVYGALRYYDLGQWDWVTTMSALVLALAHNYEQLRKIHLDLVQKTPMRPIVIQAKDITG